MKALNRLKKLGVYILSLAVIVSFTGCSKLAGKSTNNSSSSSTEAIDIDNAFSDRDMSGDYDESEAVKITLDDDEISVDGDGVEIDGTTALINKEGVYIVSGTLSEGQIQVDVGDDDKVQIVLDDANITVASTAPIYVINADKVFVTLADGSTNSLETTSDFVSIDDNNIDGVIYAKDDITINGSGSLTITSNSGHGIVCKNDLKVTGGTIDITSAEDGLQGDDSVRIADGTINVNAGDDGIHSDSNLLIIGGEINITQSEEGLEGEVITITDGNINIVSKDDGINATSGSNKTSDNTSTDTNDNAKQNGDVPEGMEAPTGEVLEGIKMPNGEPPSGMEPPSGDMKDFGGEIPSGDAKDFGGGKKGGMMDTDENAIINISGGVINIEAEGDGVDSNGYINISGGEIYVSGPTNGGNGSLDYGIDATITGGTVVMAGSSGMAENFGSDSTQGAILATVDNQSEGATITLKDSDGNEIISYTPTKSYQCVIISTADITKGKTYTLTAGASESTITMDSLIYGSGTGMSGMMKGGMRQDMKGQNEGSANGEV